MDPKSIYEMVVAGNSTMRDLFFRLNVYSIGQSPYRSITELEMAEGRRTTTSLAESGQKLLLPLHPQARVYGLPIISGHVGRRRRRVHAGRGPGATRNASLPSWTSARTRN